MKSKKKILVVLEKIFFDLYRDGLLDYAKNNNLDIDLYYPEFQKEKFSFVDKIKYKYNINNFKNEYYNIIRNNLINKISSYDQILFINLCYDEGYLISGELEKILNNKVCKLCFVDSIKTIDPEIKFFHIFDRIYSFEYQDIDYAKKKYNINIRYLPIGTSYYLYNKTKIINDNPRYDICFVGIATEKRLEYLNVIAKWCYNNKKILFIAGHFWHNNNILNYYIGKIKFKIKYPILYKYVKNIFIKPEQLANIYQNSKICLNINVAYHKSLNQRNFDIIISRSLLICDKQDISNTELIDGKDFIMCDSISMMIEKISYFLTNDEQRKIIIKNGYEKINNFYLYKNTLEQIFKDI